VKNILVTGAYGFLGSILCPALEAAGHVVLRQGRDPSAQISCNPLNQSELNNIFKSYEVDVLINLIANTDIDQCESNPSVAFKANVSVMNSIVNSLYDRTNIHLIHTSTDQLYCGSGPHNEDSILPTNVYGLTKYAAELLASRVDATVLRINFVGRSTTTNRQSLSDWLVEKLRNNTSVDVFKDIYFSPLHVSELCNKIEQTVVKRIPGVYNLGSNGRVSKSDFAITLARQLGLDLELMKIVKSTDAKLIAKRPFDMTMCSNKFENIFCCKLPNVEEQISLLAQDYQPF